MEYIYKHSNGKILVDTFLNHRKYYVRLDTRNIEIKELNRIYELEYINSGTFVGDLLMQANETFFFNIGEKGDVLAIPYNWIETMIPTKESEGEK